jgi:hypothetical protein
MQSTRRSLLVIACLAVSALVSASCREVFAVTRVAYAFVKDLAHAFVVRAVEIVAPKDAEAKAPAVLLVRAKAFVQRIVKRERPVVTASWRMCPSI